MEIEVAVKKKTKYLTQIQIIFFKIFTRNCAFSYSYYLFLITKLEFTHLLLVLHHLKKNIHILKFRHMKISSICWKQIYWITSKSSALNSSKQWRLSLKIILQSSNTVALVYLAALMLICLMDLLPNTNIYLWMKRLLRTRR